MATIWKKQCKYLDCGVEFETPYSGRKYCDEHDLSYKTRPPVSRTARDRVVEVIRTRMERRHAGPVLAPSFRAKNVQAVVHDLSPQAVSRVLDGLVDEGVLSVEPGGGGSFHRRRYRVNDPLAVMASNKAAA